MINYNVDDYGTLKIYDGKRIIVEISECSGMEDKELQDLIDEVLHDLEYLKGEDL